MASLKVGIVGLPNVGKSTLFNALMEREMAKVGQHPFTTVTPNKGMVAVPDERLEKLVKLLKKTNKDINVKPASIEFVDIAGLVKGAAEGAGLGNQFLSHIREVDLILHVLREFENPKVPHVSGRVDPVSDVATTDLELILSDFEVVAKALQEREKKVRDNKKIAREVAILQKLKKALEKGRPAISVDLSDEEKKDIGSFNLITLKPVIFIVNISEKHLEAEDYPKGDLPEGIVVPVCVKLAADLYDLDKKDRQEFLSQFKLKKTGLEQLIKSCYKTLGLITFYTLKREKVISAWPISEQTTAIDGAGSIHSDFVKRFIKAEVIDWKKLYQVGSWKEARQKGLLHFEGKNYKIVDGDIIEFIFN
ncbi:redox-regulated ATPase YchF [Patescibacteria group bacterium]